MDLGIDQRTALVAASTSGLGLAIARGLAMEGAATVLSGRRGDVAAEEAARLPRARGVEADLSDPDTPERLVAAAVEAFGPVDILVLNSGGPPPGTAAEVGVDDLRRSAETMLHAQQRLIAATLPGMRERGWGRILAVGSSGVQQPISGLALSNSIRGALAGLLKTLAAEVAGDGVTVNMVLPGRIATDRVAALDRGRAEREGRSVEEVAADARARIPAGRYGAPEEFADVAVFLCSDRAAYLTGEQVRVDGGMVGSF